MRQTFALLIQDRFSLFGYGVACDLIRMANEYPGAPAFRTITAAKSQDPVTASSGTRILPDIGWSALDHADCIFVCSFKKAQAGPIDPTLTACLRRNHRHGARIIGFGTGVWSLAQAGLLKGRKAVADPKEISALREAFPETEFSVSPYVIDGDIATCIGGDSVTDLVLALLTRDFGQMLSENVRRYTFLKPTRSMALMRSLGLYDPTVALDTRLAKALEIFDQTISDPVPLTTVCHQIGVSLRSLTRLTTEIFRCSPKTLYMAVRLNHAEMLLRQTGLSVTQIGLICGFQHSSHFSTVFKSRNGISPARFRQAVP
ncbi:MAG: helix-turn-helix domain-containing protein [Alphaproteobacteria bacterium]|nr:helix-turn-helix domain-containing protein [Alphaproteobacteria bacterium]